MGKRQISANQQVPLGCTNEIYYKAYDWSIEFMLHGSQLAIVLVFPDTM